MKSWRLKFQACCTIFFFFFYHLIEYRILGSNEKSKTLSHVILTQSWNGKRKSTMNFEKSLQEENFNLQTMVTYVMWNNFQKKRELTIFKVVSKVRASKCDPCGSSFTKYHFKRIDDISLSLVHLCSSLWYLHVFTFHGDLFCFCVGTSIWINQISLGRRGKSINKFVSRCYEYARKNGKTLRDLADIK